MSASRSILILYSESDEPDLVRQLAESITRLGSTAVVQRLCSGQYDKVLDALVIADTAIYWPPD